MRWLLTRADEGLAEALRAAGETVIEGRHVDDYANPSLPTTTSKKYPLRQIVAETSPDVVVLVDLLLARGKAPVWGYPRSVVVPWKRSRSVLTVGMGRAVDETGQDPVWGIAKNGHVRSCSCRPWDCSIYLSCRGNVAKDARRSMRAVAWVAGQPLTGLLEAVADVRAGRLYRPQR